MIALFRHFFFFHTTGMDDIIILIFVIMVFVFWIFVTHNGLPAFSPFYAWRHAVVVTVTATSIHTSTYCCRHRGHQAQIPTSHPSTARAHPSHKSVGSCN
jgi:hypothetical protein